MKRNYNIFLFTEFCLFVAEDEQSEALNKNWIMYVMIGNHYSTCGAPVQYIHIHPTPPLGKDMTQGQF